MVVRGIRNKNPLNIKRGPNWIGLKTVDCKDEVFAEFTHMRYGWRAAALLLSRYYFKYDLKNIGAIIHRWCPDKTSLDYALGVCTYLNNIFRGASDVVYSTTRILTVEEFANVLPCLMLSMSFVECGKKSVLLAYNDLFNNADLNYAVICASSSYGFNDCSRSVYFVIDNILENEKRKI